MTRKHYAAVAAIIRQHLEQDDREVAVQAIRELAVSQAGLFADENDAFDPDRFFEACDLA